LLENVLTNVPREPPFSVSQLRAYVRCPKSDELQYLVDPRIGVQDMGASATYQEVYVVDQDKLTWYGCPFGNPYEGEPLVWSSSEWKLFDPPTMLAISGGQFIRCPETSQEHSRDLERFFCLGLCCALEGTGNP
jgi:hypothetical protein